MSSLTNKYETRMVAGQGNSSAEFCTSSYKASTRHKSVFFHVIFYGQGRTSSFGWPVPCTVVQTCTFLIALICTFVIGINQFTRSPLTWRIYLHIKNPSLKKHLSLRLQNALDAFMRAVGPARRVLGLVRGLIIQNQPNIRRAE